MKDFGFSPADPDRGARGDATAQALLGVEAIVPTTPYRAAGRDFVFSEIWDRPGLDRRSRLWITLACVCAARSPIAIHTYVRAALRSGEITMAELREFALHFSVFQGFPKGAEVDAALDAIETEGARA
jgi:4-carboxymuconolactone decarboxylase